MFIVAAVYLIAIGIFYSRMRSDKLLKELYLPLHRKENKILAFFPLFKKISSIINKPFSRLAYLDKLQMQLEFLRLPFGAIELLLLKELLLVISGIAVFPYSPSYALVAGLIGFFLPDFILNNKIKAKKDAIIKFFPEAVDILTLCIGAGLDFVSSLRWIIEKSLPNPFIEQLIVVMSEIKVGKSRLDALEAMAKRINIGDINSFVRTVIQAERMGTSVEEALKNLSEDVRLNRFQRGERMAIKASLKILIPLLFFILPVIMIVVAGPIIINFSQGGLTGAGSKAGVMGF